MKVMESEKALNVLMYVAKRIPRKRNLYWVLKAIYFADKAHLKSYGRQIFPQTHQKLEAGNVPSYIYDICTHVRDGKPQPQMPRNVHAKVQIHRDDTVKPLVNVDMRFFSESELDCLNKYIAKVKTLDFDELKAISHKDPVFKRARLNSHIGLEDVIATFPNAEQLKEYLNDPYPG